MWFPFLFGNQKTGGKSQGLTPKGMARRYFTSWIIFFMTLVTQAL